MSGLLSGYPNMHLTRFNTNSTKSLWIGFLKNLNERKERKEKKEKKERREKERKERDKIIENSLTIIEEIEDISSYAISTNKYKK